MMNRMAVEISSDPRDVETYLLGIGDEYLNTSLVLMEHGYIQYMSTRGSVRTQYAVMYFWGLVTSQN